MDILYIFAGLFVNLIFLFNRNLLIETENFKLILGISIALFVGGVVLHFTDVGRFSASGALLCPLVSLLLFRLFRKLFIKWCKHEPRDTFHNWQSGLGEDRIFNIVYWVLTVWLGMFAIIGMEELAKAGW